MSSPVAIYVHIPFCPTKCGYCDFNSYSMEGEIIEHTARAIITEIGRSPHAGRPAKTIFFGGVTPTFLDAGRLCDILHAVIRAHPPIENCEITSEANPGTVDSSKFASMRAAGFNRLSIGAQSFSSKELLRLGRIHEPSDVHRAINLARDAAFDNINVDLMFALPGQSMTQWHRNLETATGLNTEHLSLYCLTVEPNTAFYKEQLRGELVLPDDIAQTKMYDMAVDACAKAGLINYEISNFAKPGYECEHNLCYWRTEEYVAYGPGAVERVGNRRWTHVKHPRLYCERVAGNGELACESEALDGVAHEHERVMLGIRLREGIYADEGLIAKARQAVPKNWIEIENERIRLTPAGRHYCNEVIVSLF